MNIIPIPTYLSKDALASHITSTFSSLLTCYSTGTKYLTLQEYMGLRDPVIIIPPKPHLQLCLLFSSGMSAARRKLASEHEPRLSTPPART